MKTTNVSRPSRRLVLGSAAATLALPFLESIASRTTAHAATCPGPAKRFIAWYKPNGIFMPKWTPTETGKAWTLSSILGPLAPVRSKMLLVSGLENQKVARPSVPPGNHAGGTGAFLTQVHVAENFSDPNRTSLDQVIAEAIGSCTPLPSLQLGIDNSASTGTCDSGPCSFSRSISWLKNTPLPNLTKPDVVFDRLFAGRDAGASAADAERRRVLRTSVLDHVREDARLLSLSLSASDKRKLDEFTTGVRGLETRLGALAGSGAQTCKTGARPGATLEFTKHVDFMIEMMALAIECDLTRVLTFMISNSGSNRDYSFINAAGGYHGLSHHQGNVDSHAKLEIIGRWHMEQLAKLAVRLDKVTEEGGKTALDNTCLFFSSEISDGDRHNHWDLPVLLLGGLGGTMAADGRHVSFVKHTFPRPPVGPQGTTSMGDLFLSILRGFGITRPTFGENGTKPLTEVLV